MLNAKLTATRRHSVRLSSLSRLAPLFLTLSPPISVLSLYRNSLSALPRRTIPNKWRDKKRQAGSSRHERGEDEELGSAASFVMGEKNYKRFAPLHLDESQIILRPCVCRGAPPLRRQPRREFLKKERKRERKREQYICIPTPYIERRQS